MKKISFTILGITLIIFGLNAQDNQPVKEEFKPSGKVSGKVFWNYRYDLSDDVNQRSAFEFTRAYLGYSYNFTEKARAVILFDGAKQTVDINGKISSQYTVFVKNAFLEYKVLDNLTLTGGVIETKMMDVQDKFGKYRYVYRPFHDEFAYGTTADLGINAEIKPIDMVKINLFVINGEGFTKLQDELGLHKAGASVIVEPVEGLLVKGYYELDGGKYKINDSTVADTCRSSSFDIWAGYKTDLFRFGAGYTGLTNAKDYYTLAEDRKMTGVYASGAVSINKNFEIFGVFFMNTLNKLPGDTETWDPKKNYNIVQGGIQFSPTKGIDIAASYRAKLTDDSKNNKNLLYLNFEFFF